jgi:Holliday junction resolvasome RuvABC endonuclease subunit
MYFIGIDYSLTCPAMCLTSLANPMDKFEFGNCFFYCVFDLSKKAQLVAQSANNIFFAPHQKYSSPEERYDNISEFFLKQIRLVSKPKRISEVSQRSIIYIEDYAFAAKGKVFHIGENTEVLKYKLWKEGIEYHLVSPAEVKKLATGKGNANKEKMSDCFQLEAKVNINTMVQCKRGKSPGSDLIDSFYICYHGINNYRLGLIT